MKKLEKIIKDQLNQTKRCDFKKMWIPNGWSCVKDEIFAKELAVEIEKNKEGL